ncbi:MAG: hypothetical protein Q8M53_10770 [Burkholderiales bacterium]|nr:hypothetical protein [Burkholderiales bacterium]
MSPKTHLHLCAAEACDKQIALHLFMCGKHWQMVPRALQRDVRIAWRAYGNAERGPDRKAHLQAAVHLRKIQEQLVHAVREKEIKRALKNQQHGDNLDLQAPERYAGETPRPE